MATATATATPPTRPAWLLPNGAIDASKLTAAEIAAYNAFQGAPVAMPAGSLGLIGGDGSGVSSTGLTAAQRASMTAAYDKTLISGADATASAIIKYLQDPSAFGFAYGHDVDLGSGFADQMGGAFVGASPNATDSTASHDTIYQSDYTLSATGGQRSLVPGDANDVNPSTQPVARGNPTGVSGWGSILPLNATPAPVDDNGNPTGGPPGGSGGPPAGSGKSPGTVATSAPATSAATDNNSLINSLLALVAGQYAQAGSGGGFASNGASIPIGTAIDPSTVDPGTTTSAPTSNHAALFLALIAVVGGVWWYMRHKRKAA